MRRHRPPFFGIPRGVPVTALIVDLGGGTGSLAEADAVLRAFALHYLAQKVEVYRGIGKALRTGGVFLNADAVSGPFWPVLREEWARFMAGQGFTLELAHQNWQAECFWRRGPIAVTGGRV